MSEILNEKNLRKGILKDLIEPVVDIDTLTPKIQKDSIVVVMRVRQSFDAGYDLSAFIEKLPFGILDTEVQEVPNKDGLYEVFLEFERDDEFPKNLSKVLEYTYSIGEELSYKGLFYGEEEPIELDEDTIRKHVRLVPEKELNEFLEYSLSNATIGRQVILDSKTYQHKMVFNTVRRITEADALELMKKGWYQLGSLNEAMIGQHYWTVQTGDGSIIVERDGKHYLFK